MVGKDLNIVRVVGIFGHYLKQNPFNLKRT